MRLLIVEDDLELARLLKNYLESHKFVVDHQPNVSLGVHAATDVNYTAIIVDRMLPDGDGLDVIRQLRAQLSQAELPPFIVLSALGDVSEKVMSLDRGAVDYIVKPYEPEELLARLRVCIKYKATGKSSNVTIGNIDYNLYDQHLSINGRVVHLRRRELAIFDVLIRHHGRVVTYSALEQAIYSYDDDIASNTMASQVSRLRKILSDTQSGVTLKVMRNIGYIMSRDQ